MRVFVTGATGWVGTAAVWELLGNGHRVLGLARSEDKAAPLEAKGAEVLLGTLGEVDALRVAARNADAVIHLASNHDFSRFAESAAQDRRAIEALDGGLEGSRKPFLVTSGVALLAPGRVATEADVPSSDLSYPRRSEEAARALTDRSICAATVRLSPSVHGVGETHGFVPILIDLARRTGVSAYIGDGANRWPAVHVSDAGRLYRLALESGVTERAYRAVAEEGIAFRDIADAIGRKLAVPIWARDQTTLAGSRTSRAPTCRCRARARAMRSVAAGRSRPARRRRAAGLLRRLKRAGPNRPAVTLESEPALSPAGGHP